MSASASSSSWSLSYSGLKASFCPECGSLLDLPESGPQVICDHCRFACPADEFEGKTIITKGSIKSQTKLLEFNSDETNTRALVDEVCQKCGHKEMFFSTAQLRSADEGQTVFYECPKCGFKFSVNA